MLQSRSAKAGKALLRAMLLRDLLSGGATRAAATQPALLVKFSPWLLLAGLELFPLKTTGRARLQSPVQVSLGELERREQGGSGCADA